MTALVVTGDVVRFCEVDTDIDAGATIERKKSYVSLYDVDADTSYIVRHITTKRPYVVQCRIKYNALH